MNVPNNRLTLTQCSLAWEACGLSAATAPQYLDPRTLAARGDTVDFSADLWFTNVIPMRTVFEVSNKKDGTPVIPNTYTETDGVLAFYKSGNYMIKMTNENVYSMTGFGGGYAEVYQEVIVIPSTDANLKSLTVSEGVLTPAFDSLVYNYTVNLPYHIDTIDINATPRDSFATVSGDLGVQQLQVGANSFSVTCTAEDGVTTKIYTVLVNRATPNVDATLASLTVTSEVGEKQLMPIFNSQTLHYTVNVSSTESYVTITAAPSDPKAIVSGDLGLKLLQMGANNFSITVTAEDGVTTKTYTLVINRTDVGIDKLIIDNGQLKIYPNPATGQLRIKNYELREDAEYVIYSVVGQVLLQGQLGQEGQIDVSNLANGMYFLKVGNQVVRFLKD